MFYTALTHICYTALMHLFYIPHSYTSFIWIKYTHTHLLSFIHIFLIVYSLTSHRDLAVDNMQNIIFILMHACNFFSCPVINAIINLKKNIIILFRIDAGDRSATVLKYIDGS